MHGACRCTFTEDLLNSSFGIYKAISPVNSSEYLGVSGKIAWELKKNLKVALKQFITKI